MAAHVYHQVKDPEQHGTLMVLMARMPVPDGLVLQEFLRLGGDPEGKIVRKESSIYALSDAYMGMAEQILAIGLEEEEAAILTCVAESGRLVAR